jgi:hypothetical protein
VRTIRAIFRMTSRHRLNLVGLFLFSAKAALRERGDQEHEAIRASEVAEQLGRIR